MMDQNRKSEKSENSEKVVNKGEGIKNLDIMGEKFQFNYERQGGKYQTKVGGCVSIIVATLSLAFLMFISRQYFDTSSPVVTTTRELSSSQSFNIVGKDLFSGIALAAFSDTLESQFSNYITMRFQLLQKSFDPRTNTTKTEPLKTIRYISCSQNKDQFVINLLKKMIEDVNLEQFLCPVFKEVGNNVTLSSDPQNFKSTYLSLKVYPCSLPDRSQCSPIQQGQSLRLIVPRVSKLVAPSNSENPVAFHWKISSFVVDISRKRLHGEILQLNRITDDRSFLQKPTVKTEYGLFQEFTTDSWERDFHQQHCTDAMIDSGECEEYFELVYEMDNEVASRRGGTRRSQPYWENLEVS